MYARFSAPHRGAGAAGWLAVIPLVGALAAATPVRAADARVAPASGNAARADVAPSPDPPAPLPAPADVTVKSDDGFEFKSLYFAAPSESSNAVLLVPPLGQRRDHFTRLARALQGRGYRVMAMDNTGQLRHVAKGSAGAPVFTPITTKILLRLVPDVAAAMTKLRAQPGVGRVSIVGFGIGANAALLAAGLDGAIGAAGVVLPSYGCDEFDPHDAFGDMDNRPVLLLESRKKWTSDVATAFSEIMTKRPDLPFEHIKLRRDAEAHTTQELEEDYEESVLAWLAKSFPSAAH